VAARRAGPRSAPMTTIAELHIGDDPGVAGHRARRRRWPHRPRGPRAPPHHPDALSAASSAGSRPARPTRTSPRWTGCRPATANRRWAVGPPPDRCRGHRPPSGLT
jgi:hypothetical protein